MHIVVMKKNKLLAVLLSITLIFLVTITAIATKGTASMKPSKEQAGIRVPIIMYHSILKDKRKINDYIVTPEAVESDFSYLKQNGYQSVLISDLIEYVYNGKALPEKPVVITFDDGYLNNLTYALPLLTKYDFKAVISVVGKFTDIYTESEDNNPNYAYLSWEDIKTVLASGRVEIGNHTYTMHYTKPRKGCKRLKKESKEEYKKILTEDISKLQKGFLDRFGTVPAVFAYPYGYISQESIPIIKELGFAATLSCRETVNYITNDPQCLYQLGRFNRSGKLSSEKFMQKITC